MSERSAFTVGLLLTSVMNSRDDMVLWISADEMLRPLVTYIQLSCVELLLHGRVLCLQTCLALL